VRQAGDPANPTVVLCHGFPELAYSWRHQMAPLAEAGFHVLAPDQRGYGHSSAPAEITAYGIGNLTDDLLALLDHFGKDDAVFVGHDWGALIVWDLARLHPHRVRAVVGVSVPFVQWPAPPTELMKMLYGDRFFYILYFQTPGIAEAELDAAPYDSMAKVMWGASGVRFAQRDTSAELPPMEGTGFLTMMGASPALPFTGPEGPWLTEADLQTYADEFANSGFFGPISYYRNLDDNFAIVKDLGPERVDMPVYFIGGTQDVVNVMDPTGVERMQNLLPDFRAATILDGVGHWTQQEAPAAFNETLLGFLKSL
jgi:pimeloyl-ACP methyl ester carboxylesterase